jgi:ABC-type transporter Mla MlaB component
MAVKKNTASTKPVKAAKAAPTRRRKPAAALAPVVEAAPQAVEASEPAPVVEMTPVADAKPVTAKRSKTARYLLPGNMEIAALVPVHADLVAMEASNDGPFVLDGAQLSVIDTAGLQLLISFVSAVKSSGKKVSWDNYSVQAYQLANELGVVEQLGD